MFDFFRLVLKLFWFDTVQPVEGEDDVITAVLKIWSDSSSQVLATEIRHPLK